MAWLLLKSNGMNLTTTSEQKTLVIIGAGPKAAAIVAKAHCLKRIGMRVPRITIIEKNCVAANWTGEHGFTNGKFRLGTSPDKDIGYPYPAHPRLNSTQQKKLQQQMLQLSWSQYLIQKECYSWWIDADRPAPTHSEWASYINWVLTQTRESHQYLNGEVKTISFQSLQPWEIQFLSIEGMRSLKAAREAGFRILCSEDRSQEYACSYQEFHDAFNPSTAWFKKLKASMQIWMHDSLPLYKRINRFLGWARFMLHHRKSVKRFFNGNVEAVLNFARIQAHLCRENKLQYSILVLERA